MQTISHCSWNMPDILPGLGKLMKYKKHKPNFEKLTDKKGWGGEIHLNICISICNRYYYKNSRKT